MYELGKCGNLHWTIENSLEYVSLMPRGQFWKNIVFLSLIISFFVSAARLSTIWAVFLVKQELVPS